MTEIARFEVRDARGIKDLVLGQTVGGKNGY